MLAIHEESYVLGTDFVVLYVLGTHFPSSSALPVLATGICPAH